MTIGRISTAETYRSAIGAVNNAQQFLSRTQQQLATGKKILQPADDPVAAAQIQGLQTSLSRLGTYQVNTTRAEAALAFEDDTLAGIEEVIQRARQLVVQAGNPALTPIDRRTLGTEIDGLLERVVSLANTKNASGEFIFGGLASTTQPYELIDGEVVDSNPEGSRNINMAPGLTVQVTDPGSKIFNAEPGNGGFTVFASATNAGSGVAGLTRADPGFDSTQDYTLSFQTGAGGQLEWVVTDSTLPVPVQVTGIYADGDAITFDGGRGSITVVGTPVAGDSFAITGNASTPASEPGNAGFSVTAGGANTGSGVVQDTTAGDTFDDTLTYSLSFQIGGGGALEWVVTDSALPTPTTVTGTYVEGQPITFDGGQGSITLSGTPDVTDTFDITPNPVPRSQSLFETLVDIRDALYSDNTSVAGRAIANTALNQSLETLDRNFAQVSRVRTEVGVRLNRVDGQVDLNSAFNVQLESTLADLESLDYADAISELNLQLVALQAAQQAFVKTTGVSLFDYL